MSICEHDRKLLNPYKAEKRLSASRELRMSHGGEGSVVALMLEVLEQKPQTTRGISFSFPW